MDDYGRRNGESAAAYRARMQAVGEAARARHLSESLKKKKNYSTRAGAKPDKEEKPKSMNPFNRISDALSGKGMAKGGKVTRADGCCMKGHTKGKMY